MGGVFGKAGADDNGCTDGTDAVEKHVAGDLVCGYSDMGG